MTLVRTLRRKLEWRNLIHHIMVKKASTMLSRWSKNWWLRFSGQPPQQTLWILLFNEFLKTLKFTKTFCVIEITSIKTKQNSRLNSFRLFNWVKKKNVWSKENQFLNHLSKILIFHLPEYLLILDCSKKQLSNFGKRVYFAWVMQILIETTPFLKTLWAGLPCAVKALCPTQATSSYAQFNQEMTMSPSKETRRCCSVKYVTPSQTLPGTVSGVYSCVPRALSYFDFATPPCPWSI